jgi:hypothetical protein
LQSVGLFWILWTYSLFGGGGEVKAQQGLKICVGMAGLAMVLVGIGCGSEGDGSSEALTKAEFIKQGDEICRVAGEKREQKIAAWKQKYNDPVLSEPKQIENVIRTVALPPIREESEQLAALEPPSADQGAVTLVKSFAQAVEEAEANPRTYVEGKAFSEPKSLAKKYGFKKCVSA